MQVTIWILYITVPSHTINLPRVFMSLSILKGYMGCTFLMPFRDITPNHPGMLKRVRRKGFTMQRGTERFLISCTLFHCVHSCVRVCAQRCMCFSVGVACKIAVLLTKLCCYWNTATYSFHTEEPLRKTKTAKVRSEWCNNLSRRFGHFSDRKHERSLITRLRSLRALINIHRRDYSLAKHYRCWLTWDWSKGQIFPGIFDSCFDFASMLNSGYGASPRH